MSSTIRERHITLKHLVIGGNRMIGLQFYPDKVIQAMVKKLPEVKWSKQFQMVVLQNNTNNLNAVFDTFKGVAWVNTTSFFKKILGKLCTPFRNRRVPNMLLLVWKI